MTTWNKNNLDTGDVITNTAVDNWDDGIDKCHNPTRVAETTSENTVTHLGDIYDGELQATVSGNTRVNLLDDDVAGCESTSGWTNFQSTDATDSSNELEGTNCLKITLTSTTGQLYRDVFSKLDLTKYYMFSGYLKNGDLSGSGARLKCALQVVELHKIALM